MDLTKILKNGPKTQEDFKSIAFEATQLFSPSTPIDVTDYFAGRKPQINDLLDTVVERGQHAVLYGERGVGKTSLAKVFKDLFPNTFRNIFSVRIRAYDTDNFSSLWRRVFKEITLLDDDSDDENHREFRLSDLYQNEIHADDVSKEFQRIFNPSDIPIIIIDEFDRLPDGDTPAKIADLIKTLSDEAINVTIIIVGVADNVSGLIKNHKSISRCLTQVPMPRMKSYELEAILDKRIPLLGMEMEEDAIERITGISRGLPAYVHALGLHAVKAACHKSKLIIDMQDVDLSIQNVLKKRAKEHSDSHYHATRTNRAEATYRQTLLACALASTDEAGYFNQSAVLKPLKEIRDKKVKLSDIAGHIEKFISKDRGKILSRIGQSKKYVYRFSDPMMQPYVIMKGLEENLISGSTMSLLASELQRRLPI